MLLRIKPSLWSSLLCLFISATMISLGSYSFIMNYSYLMEYKFYYSGGWEFSFILFFDCVSLLFFSLISLISSVVLFYSSEYMSGDKNKLRFIYLVNLFVLSMFFLVFSLNMVSIMLGWDGLGVISYILVVYYENEKASSAGMITALSNRIGDTAIMICIGLSVELGSWNFLFFKGAFMKLLCLNSVSLFIILAAITKSAQVPFSAWLPAAMAAPTPVSALVHSSTLVTAGVYLLIRVFPVLKQSYCMFYLMILGFLTTLMASLSALFEMDMKKIVALSTLSQLGIMILTLGMGWEMLAYFHMLTHAAFKALLFMCSGKIIHCSGSSQDLREMGGMSISLPFTSISMNISNMALCGIPFLSGFYSKDSLVEKSMMIDSGIYMYLCYALMVGLSMSYSVRLFFFTSLVKCYGQNIVSSGEEDMISIFSKIFLLSLSIISGSLISCLIFSKSMFIYLEPVLKFFTLSSVILGLFFGILIISFGEIKEESIYSLRYMENYILMWNLPNLSGEKILNSFFYNSKGNKTIDMGWSEHYGSQGLNYSLINGSLLLVSLQINFFKKFIIAFSLSLVLYLST